MNKHLVFVYGTLKKGFGNHVLLEQPGAKFLGEAKTDAKFLMLTTGFPVVLKGDEAHVAGEVYEVEPDTLQGLDYLESNGHLYNREDTVVHGLGGDIAGQSVTAMMYVGMDNAWERSLPYLKPVTVSDDGCYHWRR